MQADSSFKTIASASEGIFRDRGSKFIGIAFPITTDIDFKEQYIQVKKMHSKANHHCYAYRLTPDRSVYKINDDKEPSGTAGRPILNTLYSNEITDCGIVVVRYFGGTLLGVPGLINAYKAAADEAIQNTTIVSKEIKEQFQLNFNYELMNDVMNLLKSYSAKIIENTFKDTCIIEFEISKSKAEIFLNEINGNYLFKDKVIVN